MSLRDALIYDARGQVLRELAAQGFDDWQFHRAATPAEAVALHERGGCRVGIAVFDQALDPIPDPLARLVAEAEVEWVALASPEALMHPVLGPFIVHTFHDYHTLPLDPPRLRVTLGHAHGKAERRHQMRDASLRSSGRFGMTGRSPAMQRLYRQLDKVVGADAPVLLSGESGTGKELVARAIHDYSARADGPFVAMNCAAIPASLIQSELFGHEKGAFTGALQRKIGNIEASDRGVLFLDEIGDLSLELQANLLRFLQEMNVVRLGATRHVDVDTRVVAATHVDLHSAVAHEQFRADLFYRLDVVHLHLPPLRERVEDIALLAHTIFDKYATQHPTPVRGFSDEAVQAMEAHLWPGNVRELINRVRHAMIMSEHRLILPEDLGLAAPVDTPPVMTLQRARTHLDRDMIERSLRQNHCNVSQSARQLGISRVTLYRLMNRLNINP
ncbi:sigma-54-dependent Fis family transcriptional regulator [Nitrogeniibacter mangrovi]|uniref:Sigma-54-dependent Fis family transcriptional regulator n=1 Tax=Nitrogeniibacter mangrovi TaxID=2016596 RepID=A0A6C1AZP0_9RHOO|nr:sigma-54 dependent transcriptional regulator [Nitrogeniibacter mangrovi]QID16822.1 sigma-54-dependent Fis family transcriptional regulator [Nitrogeniibacter mangrovi]